MARVQQRSPVRRLLVVATALLAVAVLVVTLLAALGRPSVLPGLADCTATVGDDEVEPQHRPGRSAPPPSRPGRCASTCGCAPPPRPWPVSSTSTTTSRVVVAARPQGPRLARAQLHPRRRGAAAEPDGLDASRPDRPRRRGARGPRSRPSASSSLGGFAPGRRHRRPHAGLGALRGPRRRRVLPPRRPGPRQVRGWAVAHYLVAHADRLAVETVIFDGRIWTARRALQGWRDYAPDTSGRSARGRRGARAPRPRARRRRRLSHGALPGRRVQPGQPGASSRSRRWALPWRAT